MRSILKELESVFDLQIQCRRMPTRGIGYDTCRHYFTIAGLKYHKAINGEVYTKRLEAVNLMCLLVLRSFFKDLIKHVIECSR